MVWVKGFKYAWPKYSLRSDHLSHGLHSQMGIIFAQQRVLTTAQSRRPRLRSSRPSFTDLCYLYGTGIQSDRLYPLFLNHTYPVTIPQAPRKWVRFVPWWHIVLRNEHETSNPFLWHSMSMQHGEGPFLIFDCAFFVRVCMRQQPYVQQQITSPISQPITIVLHKRRHVQVYKALRSIGDD